MNLDPELESRVRVALTRALATGLLDEFMTNRAAAFLTTGHVPFIHTSGEYEGKDILYDTAWTLDWLGDRGHPEWLQMVEYNLKNLEQSLEDYAP